MVKARYPQDNRPDQAAQRFARQDEDADRWQRQVKCVEIATHWDCLIAAHVYAGDEVGVIASEFGIYPVTVMGIMSYISPGTYQAWRVKLAKGGVL